MNSPAHSVHFQNSPARSVLFQNRRQLPKRVPGIGLSPFYCRRLLQYLQVLHHRKSWIHGIGLWRHPRSSPTPHCPKLHQRHVQQLRMGNVSRRNPGRATMLLKKHKKCPNNTTSSARFTRLLTEICEMNLERKKRRINMCNQSKRYQVVSRVAVICETRCRRLVVLFPSIRCQTQSSRLLNAGRGSPFQIGGVRAAINKDNHFLSRTEATLQFVVKVVPHPCTHFNSALFYLKTKIAIALVNRRVGSSNDHHVKDKGHTYPLLSKSFARNDY